MQLSKETKDIQEQLGHYCQTGQLIKPIVGAKLERLPHYRRLVFNVIKDSLSSAYPLTKSLIGDEKFYQLCFAFFSTHACKEPQVYKMTGEILTYFKEHDVLNLKSEFPFIEELMLFEWTEMEMYMMADLALPKAKKSGDWLHDILVLNPESRLLDFTYPVYKVKPNQLLKEKAGQHFCVAYREKNTGKIYFIDVSPLVALIISAINTGNKLHSIFDELNQSGIKLNEEQKDKIVAFLKSESSLVLGFIH